jgi:hypothetical protein
MNTEEHDDLWRLLGRAKSPTVSPFFSRNVLRAIREEGQERPGFLVWLRRHWRVAAISTCAVVISAGVVLVHEEQSSDPDVLLAQQVSVSPDYQVISNLDELLDSEHNSVWLEASIN